MSEPTIEVQPREERGTSANRRLRAENKIPAVVYGAGKESIPIVVDRPQVLELLKKSAGANTIFLLKMKGTKQSRHTMIREMDVDPLTRKIQHIDFQRILLDEKVKVRVPIELLGTPTGVKNEEGVLDFITREVEVQCLPGDIPNQLEVDITELHVGQHVEVSDLQVSDKVVVLDDPGRVVAAVAHARVVEEVEEEEEMLLEADAEEPEVIGRTGDDDEEES